jgi:two-component system NtrC family sensor kinase
VTLLRCHPDIGQDIAIRVEDRTPGAAAFACIDEAQMKQVYVNLALNAFEAMQHRGTLMVTVELAAGDEVGLADTPCVRLCFRDTGPGVEVGQEAAIFEPFHTTKPQGTGLGLSVAARIVESHGGRIDAANHVEGGAEFTVWLPEALGDADPDSTPMAGPTAEPEERLVG